MSKIGKTPIVIKDGMEVSVKEKDVLVKGSKGERSYRIPSGIAVRVENGTLVVSAEKRDDKSIRAIYGLTRAMLSNILKGLDSGFEKKLELSGVGYRAQMQGTDLMLSVGFSHQVKCAPLPGVVISVADNVITVSGTDKMLVGEMAATIRGVRPPEPYKGKGIKYLGERVRRKAGKAAKAVGAVK